MEKQRAIKINLDVFRQVVDWMGYRVSVRKNGEVHLYGANGTIKFYPVKQIGDQPWWASR